MASLVEGGLRTRREEEEGWACTCMAIRETGLSLVMVATGFGVKAFVRD
jgi:hypothetical protein